MSWKPRVAFSMDFCLMKQVPSFPIKCILALISSVNAACQAPMIP